MDKKKVSDKTLDYIHKSLNKKREFINNSGKGKKYPVPDSVAKKFNWGAFFFNWIWGLFNKTFIIPLIILGYTVLVIASLFTKFSIVIIPLLVVSVIILQIWFGIKGNTWAWQNKKWKSIKHFHSVQKTWAIVAIVLNVVNLIPVLLALPAILIPVFTNTMPVKSSSSYVPPVNSYKQLELKTSRLKAVSKLRNAATYNYAIGTNENASYTSNGLAEYFQQGLNQTASLSGSTLFVDGAKWDFTGDGYCKVPGACYVIIDVNGQAAPNKFDEDILKVNLIDNGDYLDTDKNDLNKYTNFEN